MVHTDCPSPQQLIDFCIGKLAEAEIDAVTTHLDGCKVCLETVEALEKVPIPFVRYYLSDQVPRCRSLALDPQFQRMLAALKHLNSDSTASQG